MAGPWWILYPAFTVSLLISAPELKRAKVSEPRERIHLRDNRVTSNERGEDGLALFFLLLVLGSRDLLALDPLKALTQYTRTVWTQAQGLPQDTIRAITQTQDGYLWLGTDEGLARFDGYEFVIFTKDDSALPSNSITALWAGQSGALWIGTPNGLTRYLNRRFTTFTTKDGLPDNAITSLMEDHAGALWIAAGVSLTRF